MPVGGVLVRTRLLATLTRARSPLWCTHHLWSNPAKKSQVQQSLVSRPLIHSRTSARKTILLHKSDRPSRPCINNHCLSAAADLYQSFISKSGCGRAGWPGVSRPSILAAVRIITHDRLSALDTAVIRLRLTPRVALPDHAGSLTSHWL